MPQAEPFGLSFSLAVTDGSTETANVTEIQFTGASVTSDGNVGPARGKKVTVAVNAPPTATIEVTDGTTTVAAATEISFTGAVVTNEGGGVAGVAINSPIAAAGVVVLNGVTPVAVADAALTANSLIIFTLKTVGGTVGAYPAVQTITPGTGFTVAGTALDTSTYNYGVIG